MFTTEEIAALLVVCAEKERAADNSWNGMHRKVFWGHLGLTIERLLHYRMCCACLALVEASNRDIHPCGPCECNTPVVTSAGCDHQLTPPPHASSGSTAGAAPMMRE